jgi:hypothetical protein
MANKKIVLKQLADYFADKGSLLSVAEYKAAEDKPMRYMIAKRPFGSWHRMTSMVKSNFPEQWAKTQASAPAPTPAPKAAPKKVAPKAASAKKGK